MSPEAVTPGAPIHTFAPARRRTLLYAITLAVPFLALLLCEAILRLSWAGGAIPVFVPVEIAGSTYLVANQHVARRYFPDESPPAPPQDLFAKEKPTNGFRVFVLGESTAAGFPYPPNGTFSRVLREALHDVLPHDSVEVVNLGIAATNSFTLVDLTDAVLAQKPDAVLIYAGHNEYYGALGVGSSIRLGSSPRLVRAYLRLERFRTVMLMRHAIAVISTAIHGAVPTDSTAATFMESVAANQQIELGSPAYAAGLAQFRSNLSIVLDRMHAANVPVFIASIASNERSQAPFVSAADGAARAAFDSATHATDSATATRLFARARDLDVIRFRAPSALDDTIRALASNHDARYVPVAEAIRAASPMGVPGSEIFLEHVHPNAHGYALIAKTFFEALRQGGLAGRSASFDRLLSWDEYERHMYQSAFDTTIVHHTVRTVVTRWPFVSRERAQDYRGTYRPADLTDSLALLVSRGGMAWGDAKLRLATTYESAHRYDAALDEYLGLLRDRPLATQPWLLVGRTLFALGRFGDATRYLEHAAANSASWETEYLLGVIALQEKNLDKAIAKLDHAATLNPNSAGVVYQLSVAFGLSKNVAAARAAATRAWQLDPKYPGLEKWLAALGMKAP